MTINDTEGYTWQDFRPRVSSAIRALFDSYPTEITQLRPIRADLTYINAVPFDPTQESMTHFLRDRLHISVGVEPMLFENQERANNPIELNMNMAFPLEKPPGFGILRISNGKKNEAPALVWQIVVRSTDDQVPNTPQSLDTWLEAAHEVAETWFFTLIRGELLKTFEAAHGNNGND